MGNDSLLDAMTTLFTLQRWNFLPRVETWVEAENIALTTHVGYALARELPEITDKNIEQFLTICLLKSFNKHGLSDVPIRTRNAMKEDGGEEGNVWQKVIDWQTNETSTMFPRKIRKEVLAFLKRKDSTGAELDTAEAVLKYAQLITALAECKRNSIIYEDYYRRYINNIEQELAAMVGEQGSIPAKLHEKRQKVEQTNGDWFANYFSMMRCLKDLRRWNRLNRSIESSVLGHTFLVAFFALLFSWMHKRDIQNSVSLQDDEKSEFTRISVLSALFHDVPESLSGDIITPVKDKIKKVAGDKVWKRVEKKLCGDTVEELTINLSGVRKDIQQYKLLEDVDDKRPFSIQSMVKDCDRLALVMECLFEKRAGNKLEEMDRAYVSYLQVLQNSEWHHIREFCARLSIDYPTIA